MTNYPKTNPALEIERIQAIPIGRNTGKVCLTGFPGTIPLRTTARNYKFAAIHVNKMAARFYSTDPRAYITYHTRRDLCKPSQWFYSQVEKEDRILKIIKID